MKCFLMLHFMSGNTKAVFEVVDGFSYIHSYFVGGISFFRAAYSSGIGMKVLLRINVDHFSAKRSDTWMITVAYASGFFYGTVPFPIHFGTYEFHGRKPAAQMGSAFLTLHGMKGGIMRIVGNAVIIGSVIESFDFLFVFQKIYAFSKDVFCSRYLYISMESNTSSH